MLIFDGLHFLGVHLLSAYEVLLSVISLHVAMVIVSKLSLSVIDD